MFIYNYRSKSRYEVIEILNHLSDEIIQVASKDYLDIDKVRVLRFRYNKDTRAYLKRLEDLYESLC